MLCSGLPGNSHANRVPRPLLRPCRPSAGQLPTLFPCGVEAGRAGPLYAPQSHMATACSVGGTAHLGPTTTATTTSSSAIPRSLFHHPGGPFQHLFNQPTCNSASASELGGGGGGMGLGGGAAAYGSTGGAPAAGGDSTLFAYGIDQRPAKRQVHRAQSLHLDPAGLQGMGFGVAGVQGLGAAGAFGGVPRVAEATSYWITDGNGFSYDPLGDLDTRTGPTALEMYTSFAAAAAAANGEQEGQGQGQQDAAVVEGQRQAVLYQQALQQHQQEFTNQQQQAQQQMFGQHPQFQQHHQQQQQQQAAMEQHQQQRQRQSLELMLMQHRIQQQHQHQHQHQQQQQYQQQQAQAQAQQAYAQAQNGGAATLQSASSLPSANSLPSALQLSRAAHLLSVSGESPGGGVCGYGPPSGNLEVAGPSLTAADYYRLHMEDLRTAWEGGRAPGTGPRGGASGRGASRSFTARAVGRSGGSTSSNGGFAAAAAGASISPAAAAAANGGTGTITDGSGNRVTPVAFTRLVRNGSSSFGSGSMKRRTPDTHDWDLPPPPALVATPPQSLHLQVGEWGLHGCAWCQSRGLPSHVLK